MNAIHSVECSHGKNTRLYSITYFKNTFTEKLQAILLFQAVKTDESIKAEEIDGYRGGDDLEDLLKFIESKPGNADSKGSKSIEAKSSPSSTDTAQKSKRSRRTDRKSKRSRTPSVTGKKNYYRNTLEVIINGSFFIFF